MISRAAQTHMAGHMRPHAGRVFETPDLDYYTITISFWDIHSKIEHQQDKKYR